jgi:hypothetical protein
VGKDKKYGSDMVAYETQISNDMTPKGMFVVKIKAIYRPIKDTVQKMTVFAAHTGHDGLKQKIECNSTPT